jgi:hypothetical protein
LKNGQHTHIQVAFLPRFSKQTIFRGKILPPKTGREIVESPVSSFPVAPSRMEESGLTVGLGLPGKEVALMQIWEMSDVAEGIII